MRNRHQVRHQADDDAGDDEGGNETGDGAKRDADGRYRIIGRVDDVINVSGHRFGTAEIESALVAHEAVAEAAVVGYPHDIKGTGIYCYVLLNAGWADGDPADVGRAEIDVARVVVEDEPVREGGVDQVPAGRVHQAFGFAGAARRIGDFGRARRQRRTRQ